MRDPFDLILMDIRMPELDGMGAMAELRRNGCCVRLALTASTSDRQQILAAGFDDFWFKPISLTDLVDRVASFLPTVCGQRNDPGQLRHSDSKLVAMQDPRIRSLRSSWASLPARMGSIRNALDAADFRRAEEALQRHRLARQAFTGSRHCRMRPGRLLQWVKSGST